MAAATSLYDRAWSKPKEHPQLDGESSPGVLSLEFVGVSGERLAPDPQIEGQIFEAPSFDQDDK